MVLLGYFGKKLSPQKSGKVETTKLFIYMEEIKVYTL